MILFLLLGLVCSLQHIHYLNTLFHRLEYKMDTNLIYQDLLHDTTHRPTLCRITDGPACALINKIPFFKNDSTTTTVEYTQHKEYTISQQQPIIEKMKILQNSHHTLDQLYIQADANRALLDYLREHPGTKAHIQPDSIAPVHADSIRADQVPADSLKEKTARLSAKTKQVQELKEMMQLLQDSVIDSLDHQQKQDNLIANIDMDRLDDPKYLAQLYQQLLDKLEEDRNKAHKKRQQSRD